MALAVHDNRPVGVLVTCHGDFSQLSVYQNDDKDQPSSLDTPLITWGVNGTPATEVVEVPLFGPVPKGWKLDETRDIPASEAGLTVEIEPLTELKPGIRYSLGGTSHRHAVPVDFTTADFVRIGPDEVLAPTGRETMKIMSRDAFIRTARDSCN